VKNNGSPLASREAILGYPVSTLCLEACIREIADRIAEEKKGLYLACANPHSLMEARHDAAFERALKGADLLLPDGAGIVMASRILGGQIRERITGSDIFREVNRFLAQEGRSCFLLGATMETLAKIKARLAVDFPGLSVAGVYAPPFSNDFDAEEDRRMLRAIHEARPDVLWVGMSAPKQEKWILRNKGKLDVKFIGAVGAVFDFFAGNVRRSHPWFLEHGLEWLPRLLQEPRRLWKRTFISAPLFLLRVLRQKITAKV